MQEEDNKIIIKGITREGRQFRPSDWAQRLTTAVSTPGPDRRIRFHPKIRMATIGGINCVVMDASLESEDPRLFDFIINFGKNNNLQIVPGGNAGEGRSERLPAS